MRNIISKQKLAVLMTICTCLFIVNEEQAVMSLVLNSHNSKLKKMRR